ncbi:MAG: hypothetical protein WB760_17615 [Xanthobacteraceae bacterium]
MSQKACDARKAGIAAVVTPTSGSVTTGIGIGAPTYSQPLTNAIPDGQIVLLTLLREGQEATVLQLPAVPKTLVETEAQQRHAAYVG